MAADPDNALVHSGLSTTWAALGFDGKARDEAKAALDLAQALPEEEKLLIQGRYFETIQDWEQAVEIYFNLFSLFPDNLDHGLRLAAAQTAGGRAEEALSTADALRALPSPADQDPRIDLAEAAAAGARADFKRQESAAARAAVPVTFGKAISASNAITPPGAGWKSLRWVSIRPDVHVYAPGDPERIGLIARLPAPSWYTFAVLLVISSISPVPRTVAPVTPSFAASDAAVSPTLRAPLRSRPN